MKPKNVVQHNKQAWNKKADENDRWTVPVTHEDIEAAREGHWKVLLTNCRPVPRDWFPPLKGIDLLCLASGGGQQAPIFAAAGANVTSFDNSPRQLEQDQLVAEREGLNIQTIEGDMADLGVFSDNSFDLIFNPISNLFIPELEPLWKETFRVLRPGGYLLVGFVNPVIYAFNIELEKKGIYQVKYSLPYSDTVSLTPEERAHHYGEDAPIEYSHTLEAQIGGQTKAGFHIVGFYESYVDDEKINNYMPSFIATRAIKPKP